MKYDMKYRLKSVKLFDTKNEQHNVTTSVCSLFKTHVKHTKTNVLCRKPSSITSNLHIQLTNKRQTMVISCLIYATATCMFIRVDY